MAACYEMASPPPQTRHPPAPHKDYARPLHVDCSVEYELPNQAKPPEGAQTEPLLMIHPCYYRRAESQRRSPFINNLPTRGLIPVPSTTRRVPVPRLVPQQHFPSLRYLDTSQSVWQHPSALEPLYSKHASVARDPLLCGGGDFSSGSDSGVSAGHWTDSDRSPDVRLRDYQATDSGVATPVSLDEKNILSDLLAPSSSHTKDRQPAVAMAAVACKGCRYHRLLQQPWAAAQFPVAVAPGRRAVEPGPEHAASRRTLPAWGRATASGAVKRAKTSWAHSSCATQPNTDSTGYYSTAVSQCARGTAQDNSRILWNNESMLRLFQV